MHDQAWGSSTNADCSPSGVMDNLQSPRHGGANRNNKVDMLTNSGAGYSRFCKLSGFEKSGPLSLMQTSSAAIWFTQVEALSASNCFWYLGLIISQQTLYPW
ncbi:unnamed protein product [Phytophthora fragariaefolia]|uniref:Unnamed protein product n=1 Tax=Phytophthora fragariaefolia TaxID=1490495 RepID=A0A9W6Y009_9STRA|nr:unnamed protein product [Phytophthora fragariaefolia]